MTNLTELETKVLSTINESGSSTQADFYYNHFYDLAKREYNKTIKSLLKKGLIIETKETFQDFKKGKFFKNTWSFIEVSEKGILALEQDQAQDQVQVQDQVQDQAPDQAEELTKQGKTVAQWVQARKQLETARPSFSLNAFECSDYLQDFNYFYDENFDADEACTFMMNQLNMTWQAVLDTGVIDMHALVEKYM